MSIPPKNPLNGEKGNRNYFNHLVSLVQPDFSAIGVKLDFSGYNKLIDDYINLTSNDNEKAWDLAKDFSLWGEYIGDILNLTNKFLLDSETNKLEQSAIVSYEADNVKVSAGDRLANKSPVVVQARKTRNSFKAFALALEGKQKFLEKAYHHCKNTYNLIGDFE